MVTIEGYENYHVTKEGEIWSNKYRKFLKPIYNIRGYKRVRLYDKLFHSKRFLVHRLVALAYIPNKEKKKEVNHIDENIHNNNASNLEWVTRSENVKHSIRLRKEREKVGVPF